MEGVLSHCFLFFTLLFCSSHFSLLLLKLNDLLFFLSNESSHVPVLVHQYITCFYFQISCLVNSLNSCKFHIHISPRWHLYKSNCLSRSVSLCRSDHLTHCLSVILYIWQFVSWFWAEAWNLRKSGLRPEINPIRPEISPNRPEISTHMSGINSHSTENSPHRPEISPLMLETQIQTTEAWNQPSRGWNEPPEA